MTFIAKITNKGQEYWMRNTVWTFSEDRADKFATREEVIARTIANKQFMKPGMFKLIEILEIK